MANVPSRELLKKVLGDNHEAIKYFENLFRSTTDFSDDITSLQEEINRIETGAGLDTDGTYIQPSGTNFLDTATSLYNADLLLDAAIASITGKLVVTIINNYNVTNQSQNILANANNNTINVTLPNPSTFIGSGVSKVATITKIDTSANTVTILPNGGETIAGQASQVLSAQNDIISLITDGANWWLGN